MAGISDNRSAFLVLTLDSTLLQEIKEKISTSEDPNEELLSDGKKHGPSWLHGRCPDAVKGYSSTAGSTNTYVQELAGKIKQTLVSEVEASMIKKVQEEVDMQVNKKVQENMAWLLKKIADANPGITINHQDFSTTSDNDNYLTPVTGGSGL
ncbi:hypothetical protein AgCh_006382 [Apium graveolens]